MVEGRLWTRVLVDAGPLVAIFNRHDQHHDDCVETLNRILPPLLTTWPVVTEAAWLLRGSSQTLHRLLEGPSDGLFRLLPLDEDAMPELASLMRKYRKLGLQLADASLVHLAHREGIDTIFTLDRRDFAVFRGPRNRGFTLLP